MPRRCWKAGHDRTGQRLSGLGVLRTRTRRLLDAGVADTCADTGPRARRAKHIYRGLPAHCLVFAVSSVSPCLYATQYELRSCQTRSVSAEA